MRTTIAMASISTTNATILTGLVLILLRVYIGFNFQPEHFSWLQAYKDASHIFIGGLFVAWFIQRHKWQWQLFWLLCIVEVTVALLSRFPLC